MGDNGSFGMFFRLGIDHILTGHDHLLFLLGLWLVVARVRELVWVVTSFSVAHSLTLAASTLGWVRVPDALIEPAIAATIAYVGVENLVRRGEPRGRVVVTFVFGLLHGFGFSNVMREVMGIADAAPPVVPLLAFNCGVEAGQLIATGIGLPLIWWLRQAKWTRDRTVPIGSGLVAAGGVFWFIERMVA